MSVSFSQTVLYPGLTPVRLVSVSNIAGTYYNGQNNDGIGATFTIAASSLTIDSVVCQEGDRVLLQDQTLAYQNGIYIVQEIASSVILQRSADFQCIEQMKAGQFVTVAAGTANNGAAFVLCEPLPARLGVNTLSFVSSPISAALGTAGSKAATDNSLPDVASTAGSGFTVGNFTAAADTAGSIEDSGISAANVLQKAVVAVSSAEFLGAYAAPKLIVAAPGAAKLIVVDKIVLSMEYGAAAYAAGGVVAFQYDDTANGAGVSATTTQAAAGFQATADTNFLFSGVSTALAAATTVNQGLYLSNLTAAFTTGDSDFEATVYYRIVDVA